MTFTVAGMPATKGSTRAFQGRRGRVYVVPDNPRTHSWQRAVGWAATVAGAVPLAGAVRVAIVFELARPTSPRRQAGRAVGAPCLTKPDLDKLIRAILDGLTTVCYADDSQVTEIHARKIYGDTPCAVITVDAL